MACRRPHHRTRGILNRLHSFYKNTAHLKQPTTLTREYEMTKFDFTKFSPLFVVVAFHGKKINFTTIILSAALSCSLHVAEPIFNRNSQALNVWLLNWVLITLLGFCMCLNSPHLVFTYVFYFSFSVQQMSVDAIRENFVSFNTGKEI